MSETELQKPDAEGCFAPLEMLKAHQLKGTVLPREVIEQISMSDPQWTALYNEVSSREIRIDLPLCLNPLDFLKHQLNDGLNFSDTMLSIMDKLDPTWMNDFYVKHDFFHVRENSHGWVELYLSEPQNHNIVAHDHVVGVLLEVVL
jgi:hypothetical protein